MLDVDYMCMYMHMYPCRHVWAGRVPYGELPGLSREQSPRRDEAGESGRSERESLTRAGGSGTSESRNKRTSVVTVTVRYKCEQMRNRKRA